MVCTTSQEFLHKLSETISGKHICILIVLTGVSTWLQFVVVTDCLSKCSRWMGSGTLLKCCLQVTLYRAEGRQCAWCCVGLQYGLAQAKDSKHQCSLLMAIWMQRDPSSPGPLSCHSPTAITLQHDDAWPHVPRVCALFREAHTCQLLNVISVYSDPDHNY